MGVEGLYDGAVGASHMSIAGGFAVDGIAQFQAGFYREFDS